MTMNSGLTLMVRILLFTDDLSLTRPADGIFDRAGIQEYILYAGQHPAGGLRDKPPKYDSFNLRSGSRSSHF